MDLFLEELNIAVNKLRTMHNAYTRIKTIICIDENMTISVGNGDVLCHGFSDDQIAKLKGTLNLSDGKYGFSGGCRWTDYTYKDIKITFFGYKEKTDDKDVS